MKEFILGRIIPVFCLLSVDHVSTKLHQLEGTDSIGQQGPFSNQVPPFRTDN